MPGFKGLDLPTQPVFAPGIKLTGSTTGRYAVRARQAGSRATLGEIFERGHVCALHRG